MGKLITVFEGSSCCEVWLQAVGYLFRQRAACYNIVLGMQKPDQLSAGDFQIQERVDEFLRGHDAYPISTVATTIFPANEYLHGGANEVYVEFPKTYVKFRENWGTYAGRMLERSLPQGGVKPLISPLEQLVNKMKQQRERQHMRSAYEVSLVEREDLLADIPIYRAASDSRRVMSGPCLSHLSFKLLPEGKVMLTAIYRSHYYIERALGNLLGLAQLLAFVANEVGIGVGSLVCHSTYAVIDTDGGWTRTEVGGLIEDCKRIASGVPAQVFA
jgi:hypothetical protein